MMAVIQRCGSCGTVNYPARALCRACLADDLEIIDAGGGTVLAVTTLHRSFDPAYASALPLRIATVALAIGPHLHAFLADGVEPGDSVQVVVGSSPTDSPTWHAVPSGEAA